MNKKICHYCNDDQPICQCNACCERWNSTIDERKANIEKYEEIRDRLDSFSMYDIVTQFAYASGLVDLREASHLTHRSQVCFNIATVELKEIFNKIIEYERPAMRAAEELYK